MDTFGLLAWLAAAVGTSTALPQLVKIWRTRVTTGVSTRLWQLSLLNSIAWVAHGHLTDQPAITWPTLAVALMQASILVLVRRAEHRPVPVAFAVPLVLGAFLIGVDLALGPVAFGLLATIAPVLGQLAQLRVMHRAADLFGVSREYLVLNLASQALWFVHGILAVEWALRISSGSMTVACSLTLGYYLWRRIRLAQASAVVALQPAA